MLTRHKTLKSGELKRRSRHGTHNKSVTHWSHCHPVRRFINLHPWTCANVDSPRCTFGYDPLAWNVFAIQTSHRRDWPLLHRKHSACLHAPPLASQTYGCILICRRQFVRSVRVPCAGQGFLCDQHGILTFLFCAPYTLMLKFGGDLQARLLGVDRWGIVGHQTRHHKCPLKRPAPHKSMHPSSFFFFQVWASTAPTTLRSKRRS